jgi:hypothetical protein
MKHLKMVLVVSGVLLISGGASAGAASLISGSNIKKNSIPLNRLTKATQNKIKSGVSGQAVVPGQRGPAGTAGIKGNTGAPGAAGANGTNGAKGDTGTVVYNGEHWGQIDRNTIGSPVAQLRSGPYVRTGTGAGAPPLGKGSLGLNVGTVGTTGDTREKVSFGNEVDFVGNDVADLTAVGLHVYWTGEDKARSADNLPNITFEVDPTGITDSTTGSNYSSLVFIPAGTSVEPNQWNAFDATTSGTWYFTGAAGTATNCTLSTPCSFSAMKTAVGTTYNKMDVLSPAVVKGRDTTFQGAVDALRYNDKVYDFEPFGVTAVAAP